MCVCVCVCERERERGRERAHVDTYGYPNMRKPHRMSHYAQLNPLLPKIVRANNFHYATAILLLFRKFQGMRQLQSTAKEVILHPPKSVSLIPHSVLR